MDITVQHSFTLSRAWRFLRPDSWREVPVDSNIEVEHASLEKSQSLLDGFHGALNVNEEDTSDTNKADEPKDIPFDRPHGPIAEGNPSQHNILAGTATLVHTPRRIVSPRGDHSSGEQIKANFIPTKPNIKHITQENENVAQGPDVEAWKPDCRKGLQHEYETKLKSERKTLNNDHQEELRRIEGAHAADVHQLKRQKKLVEDISKPLLENHEFLELAYADARKLRTNRYSPEERHGMVREKYEVILEALTFAENVKNQHDAMCATNDCTEQMNGLRNAERLLQQRLRSCLDENHLLRSSLVSAKDDANVLKDRLRKATDENRELRGLVTRAGVRNRDLNHHVSSLTAELKDQDIACKDAIKLSKAENIDDAFIDLFRLKAFELTTLRTQVNDRTQQVQDLQRENHQDEIKRQSMRNKAISALKVVDINAQNKIKQSEIAATEQELKANRAEQDKIILTAEKEASYRERDALQGEIRGLQAENQRLSTLVEKAAEQVRGRNADFSHEQTRSRSLVVASEPVLPDIQNVVNHLNEENATLKEQVKTLKDDLEKEIQKNRVPPTKTSQSNNSEATPEALGEKAEPIFQENISANETSSAHTADKASQLSVDLDFGGVSNTETFTFTAGDTLSYETGLELSELQTLDAEKELRGEHSTSADFDGQDDRDVVGLQTLVSAEDSDEISFQESPTSAGPSAPKPRKTKAERRQAAIKAQEEASEVKAEDKGKSPLSKKERRAKIKALLKESKK